MVYTGRLSLSHLSRGIDVFLEGMRRAMAANEAFRGRFRLVLVGDLAGGARDPEVLARGRPHRRDGRAALRDGVADFRRRDDALAGHAAGAPLDRHAEGLRLPRRAAPGLRAGGGQRGGPHRRRDPAGMCAPPIGRKPSPRACCGPFPYGKAAAWRRSFPARATTSIAPRPISPASWARSFSNFPPANSGRALSRTD